jgi:hypothetical protein
MGKAPFVEIERCFDRGTGQIKNGSADFFTQNQQSRLAHVELERIVDETQLTCKPIVKGE